MGTSIPCLVCGRLRGTHSRTALSLYASVRLAAITTSDFGKLSVRVSTRTGALGGLATPGSLILEGVLDGQAVDLLAVLKVFGQQSLAAGFEGGGNDEAVVKTEAVALL